MGNIELTLINNSYGRIIINDNNNNAINAENDDNNKKYGLPFNSTNNIKKFINFF